MPFVWMMVSIAVWSLGYGLELIETDLSGKIFWAQVEIFGIASIAVFLYFFSAAYTGRNKLLSPQNQVLIWIVPSITIFLTWLPQARFLIWETTTIGSSSGLTYLATDFGNWFWLQTAYSYTLIGIASVFMFLEAFHSPRPYNIQAGIVLVGIVFPWTGSFIYLSGIFLSGIDLTPFAFVPTVLIFVWGIMRYRFLDILPMPSSNILQELQEGVIVLDIRHRILYLNSMAEQLLQTTAEGAIGRLIGSVHIPVFNTFKHLLDSQDLFVEREFKLNGQDRIFDIRLSNVLKSEGKPNSAGASYLLTFRDIHQRKQIELNLKRREAIMGALTRASQQFLRSAAWEAHIPAFLEDLGQAAEVGRAFVFQNYEERNEQEFTSLCYEWVAPGIAPQIDNPASHQIPVQAIGPASWSADLSQERLVAALIQDLPEENQAAFLNRGVRSIVIAPIFVERRWWGFLGLEDYTQERQWSKAKLDALQTAAEIFSASEIRARNESTLHRRQRTLNLLHEIVVSALQTTDRRSMAQTIVNSLGDLLNTDGCYLSLWDESGEKFTPLAANGLYSKTYLSLVAEPGEPTLTASALVLGRALIIEDLSNTPYLSPRIAAQMPFRSAMSLPLIAGEKKLGAILFAYSQPHMFQPEEIANGEQAAGLIALTLEKFDAIEEARKRAEEAEMLRKAGAAVAATLHSEEAINRILEQLSFVIPTTAPPYNYYGGTSWRS
jgi:GAF domain-containing protein/PAS domain-containing protein